MDILQWLILKQLHKKIYYIKVPIKTLHFENVPLSEYIDEFFTKGDTFWTCEENVHKNMHFYDKLGFVINVKRYQIIPTQRIESQALWLICDWKWSLHLPEKKSKN